MCSSVSVVLMSKFKDIIERSINVDFLFSLCYIKPESEDNMKIRIKDDNEKTIIYNLNNYTTSINSNSLILSLNVGDNNIIKYDIKPDTRCSDLDRIESFIKNLLDGEAPVLIREDTPRFYIHIETEESELQLTAHKL